MKLGFEESQAPYDSGSQQARAWTEQWVATWLYCPHCGAERLSQLTANMPVADFRCLSCAEQYELKSKKGQFGPKVVDGAYGTMCERLASLENPSLMLLSYDRARLQVTDVCVVPKQFFIRDVIEERKPLAATARRAGWIGCNILLRNIPHSARIYFVRNGVPEPRDLVLERWRNALFLRQESAAARGWLVHVLRCVESIGRREFSLSDVYAFEERLQNVFPDNRNVRPKIRQQLQVLRDAGILAFKGGGEYRLLR